MGFAGNPLKHLHAGLLSLRALRHCTRIIRKFMPRAVLGVGGYASAPAVVAARALGVPTFLHEQNSVPGRHNRLASRFTTQTLVTFPAAEERLRRSVRVGMPTRADIFDASRAEALRDLHLEPPVVVVFGGSGGALRINLSAAEAFRGYDTIHGGADLGPQGLPAALYEQPAPPHPRVHRRHGELSGRRRRGRKQGWRGLAVRHRSRREGGDTIPFPYATGDHQLHNARYFTERGAAELMPDAEVDAASLRRRVDGLLEDDGRRKRMAERMKGLATPHAAGEVAERLLRATGKEQGPEDTHDRHRRCRDERHSGSALE